MIQAIVDRRSIRRYGEEPVPHSAVKQILDAGRLAPSSKNGQPWHFVVAQGASRQEALKAMEKGLEREKNQPFLPESAPFLGGAWNTLRIMNQSPVLIFVVNPEGKSPDGTLTLDERVTEICSAQSVGAAIENMTLEATDLGLGSLWICDSYFAYPELMEWLGGKGALYGVLAVGYPAEAPAARPRRAEQETVEWRN